MEQVPSGALLIHAGMPKTGTTALQRTAAARRALLLDHGVRYPGRGSNHRKALFAFSSRPVSWAGPGASVPQRDHWDRLKAELHRDDGRRLWLSNENLSDEPEDTLRSLLDEIGGPVFVVLTVRSLPAQLASAWQQYLKSGVWTSFESWLQRVLGDPPDPATTPSFAARLALGDVVDKWVRLVGQEHVLVVVLDPGDRALVPHTFERLLDLPGGTLEEDQLRGHHQNRSMTAPEAELVRRVNKAIRKRGDVPWRDYERFVRDGAVAAMLANRVPAPDEQRILPSRWAVERATALAEEQIERIAASQVRVVGSLEHLRTAVPAVERASAAKSIPVDAAVEALLAVLSTGLGRGPSFGPPPLTSRPGKGQRVEDMPTASVARLLAHRVGQRVARILPSAGGGKRD